MYAGQFDWNTCYSCQGVRRYVKEALMGMIEVHSEVCVLCSSGVVGYLGVSKIKLK